MYNSNSNSNSNLGLITIYNESLTEPKRSVGQMGNSQLRLRRLALVPQNPMLLKGYSCYYHNVISSIPSAMVKTKGVILDYTPDHKLYTIKCDDGVIHSAIPHLYVSSSRTPSAWEDYFKPGVIVRWGGKQCEIVDIRSDKEYEAVLDVKELSTGFTRFGVPASSLLLDINYYKDW